MSRACVLGLVVAAAAAAAAAADIHAAVGADSPIMIREALEAGASVDAISPGGQTPLMAAVLQGKVSGVMIGHVRSRKVTMGHERSRHVTMGHDRSR